MLTRRRTLMASQAEGEDEMKEWKPILDIVAEEEIPLYSIGKITTMPNGSDIESQNFREIAAYMDIKANAEGTEGSYMRLALHGANGNSAGVQTGQSVPKTGYRRLNFHIILGNPFNIGDARQVSTTAIPQISGYDGLQDYVDILNGIELVWHSAPLGAGTIIRIMGR